ATSQMKLSPTWLREFVDPQVDNHRLAEDLTAVGIAVESINGEGENTIFEMEIGTNRPDAMNHYGVAREASVIYNLGLKRIEPKLPPTPAAKAVSLGGVGETLKTLDGVERKLTSQDLVVADACKPVSLAGVMGGFDTMITEKTRNILIESAWWDPGIIRKMSRRHGLHTDASHRFERGADFESTVVSCDRVAELILESAGGELVGGPMDVIARKIDLAPVALHLSEVHRILGEKLETKEIFRI